MPGCAAVGCNNRSEKGYMMKCFPRDPNLRKVWQERVARADWEPSNNSFLCHVHFQPQEWSITQSGRIRLKKNAIPSIFTVTSTRKSSKKCKKLVKIMNESTYQNDYSVEYLENDTEHSSTGHIEGRDSDYQDMDETSLQSSEYQKLRQFSDSAENKDKHGGRIPYRSTNVQDDSTALVSDNNDTDMDGFTKERKVHQRINANGRQADKPTSVDETANFEGRVVIKTEVKSEVISEQVFDDSYDEIEEKLKQICDGDLDNESSPTISTHPAANVRAATMDPMCALNNSEQRRSVKYTDCKSTAKSEIGYVLADKRENVEIIFGAESGDEKYVCPTATPNTSLQSSKVEQHVPIICDVSSLKQEQKVYAEDIEQNFTKDEVHVIPNMRAAMKRKRRTREEIMKSIKKSIGSASDQDLNMLSNSDLSDNTTDKDTEVGKGDSPCKRNVTYREDDEMFEGVKFTIKVTGDPEDVTDVIEELSSKTTERHDLDDLTNCQDEDGLFVTSVITIQDYPLSLLPRLLKEVESEDEISMRGHCAISKSDVVTDLSRFSTSQEASSGGKKLDRLQSANNTSGHQREALYLQNFVPSSDDDSKSLVIDIGSSEKPNRPANETNNNTGDNASIRRFDELQQKIKIQEEVIEKLTDQIIIYKSMENNLRNKNLVLQAKTKEVETLTQKLNMKSLSAQNLNNGKKSLESKQRLIEDLSSRVNYLEEMNKKLMKTVTLESQQKRKLEGQIKQRDNRIKELNWKLEKASKYLERAEKNTNTYRRKMLNMQTVMRRKKLLDEKMSRFSEMLIESGKDEFSEKALATAIEIRKTCGIGGYDKLLSCGFPLPPLDYLQKKFNEDLSNCNDSDPPASATVKRNARKVERLGAANKRKVDTKDWSLVEVGTNGGGEFESAETVTGTVQDIFDENNDGDDFSTNELREHFILELKAVM